MTETREMMGTYIAISVYEKRDPAQDAIDAAFERIEEIEAIASRFDNTSELFALNRDGSIQGASEELLGLMRLSKHYGALTDGSFDVTVLPIIDLYNYDPDAELQFWELPIEEQQAAIDEALELVGHEMIDISGDTVSFNKTGMGVTLDGIAKGYAVDQGLEVLRELGIEHAVINAGGDISTIGSKPGDVPWVVALENPEDRDDYIARLEVSGKAVATSGNYRRFYDPDESVGHILDPSTGFSANGSMSVTIIADNCTEADVLATAVFVMGPEDGMALVESLDGVEALVIDTDKHIYESTGLGTYKGQ